MSDVEYPQPIHSVDPPIHPPPSPNDNSSDLPFLSQHPSSKSAAYLPSSGNALPAHNSHERPGHYRQPAGDITTDAEHPPARGSTEDLNTDSNLAMEPSSSPDRPLSLSSLSRDEAERQSGSQRQIISISTPNPSHLFWVPATHHPEIAPAEFEKFLRVNAMAKRERASLRRRSSILSVSFTANDAEKQDQEETQGAAREHLQPTANDSAGDQGLEESESQRKTRLRRSISLGTISAAAESQMRLPDFLVFDRNSSPCDQSQVLVPRADRSSLLRRGARTRFQRNSSFTPSAPRRQVDRHRQAESMPPVPFNRDMQQSFEGIILSDSAPSADINEQQQPQDLQPEDMLHQISRPEQEQPTDTDDEDRLQACDIQSLAVGDDAATTIPTTTPTPSHPPTPPVALSPSVSEPTFQRKQQTSEAPIPLPPTHADRSEKKSSWSWGFRKTKSEQSKQDHHAAKMSPSSPPAAPEPQSSISSEPSNNGKKFGLSSLFSRKSSSSKVQPANGSGAPAHAAGVNGSAVPKDFQLNRINQNRLPIHIERAIYRLSHTKLANPRRPLHEQVLISNLMFWYLSVVSSSQPNGSVEAGRKFVNAGKKGKRQQQQQQKQQQQGRPANNSKTPNNRTTQQQHASLQQYMGNNASTGFVIPDNYLRPKGGGGGPKHRKPSLSDSDDDDDDDDDDSSSSSSSDEETCKKPNTITEKKPSARPNIKGAPFINHTPSTRKERDDDIPLAMYRSKGRA